MAGHGGRLGTVDAERSSGAAGRIATGLLALGFIASFGGLIPLVVSWIVGPTGVLIGTMAALGLFTFIVLREPSRRVAWLIAPAIVVATGVLVIFNVPGNLRFAIVEPELTSYAQRVERGELVPQPTPPGPLVVGTIPILEVDIGDGVIRLVTAYVGILGDYRAGLAYAPAGVPSDSGRYDHLSGSWYRWFEVDYR